VTPRPVRRSSRDQMVRALEHAAQHENEEWRTAWDDAERAAAQGRICVLLDIHHLLDADESCDCVRIVRGQPSRPERSS
jgi:hypothetical protein